MTYNQMKAKALRPFALLAWIIHQLAEVVYYKLDLCPKCGRSKYFGTPCDFGDA
jgi:hypothetical protein